MPCTIVVIPAELLCASPIVLLARRAGISCCHPVEQTLGHNLRLLALCNKIDSFGLLPVRPGGAVVGLVDLAQVDEAGGLLLEVREHVRQNLPEEIFGFVFRGCS